MGVFAPIPLPKSGMSAFDDFFNDLSKRKLAEAQSQEAQGKAAQATMLANLIQKLSSGAGGNSPGGESGSSSSPNAGLALSQLLGINPVVANGTAYTPMGNVKIGETNAETRAGQTAQHSEEKGSDLKLTRANDLLKAEQANQEKLQHLYAAKSLLEKNPNAVGVEQGLRNWTKQANNEETPKLNTLFGDILTSATRELSNAGGAKAGAIASKYKMSVGGNNMQTKAQIDQLIQEAIGNTQRYASEYNQLTGGKKLHEDLGVIQQQAQPQDQGAPPVAFPMPSAASGLPSESGRENRHPQVRNGILPNGNLMMDGVEYKDHGNGKWEPIP